MRRMGAVDFIMQVRIVRKCCLRCKFEVGCIEYPDKDAVHSTKEVLKMVVALE